MSNKAITIAGSLKCGHGGSVAKLSAAQKLTVGGNSVMTEADVKSQAIATGCSQTGSNQVPCSKIVKVTGTAAKKLTVGGAAVITETLGGQTNGLPKNTDLAGSAGQSTLTAS